MKYKEYFWWVVLAFVMMLVGYAILGQGQTVHEFGFGGDKGVSVRLTDLENIPEPELEARQDDLEDQLDDIQKTLRETNQEQVPQQVVSFDLTGMWQSDAGLSYEIVQIGDVLTIQESNPYYGITAVGEGEIIGQTVNIFYVTAAYTQGTGVLQVSENGREIEARFTDHASGLTSSTTLRR